MTTLKSFISQCPEYHKYVLVKQLIYVPFFKKSVFNGTRVKRIKCMKQTEPHSTDINDRLNNKIQVAYWHFKIIFQVHKQFNKTKLGFW